MTSIGKGQRVLITGGHGQLGVDVARAFVADGWQVQTPSHAELDVTDRAAVIRFVSTTGVDLIVNAAAWTDPQGCENDPARAWRTHAMAVRHLGEAARATGAHLVQISTDYVFDGTPGTSHTEWDRPVPTSVYGRSKLGGEHEAPERATIIRTSRLMGATGNNVARNVLRLAADNPDQTFRFDDFHKGCPTFTADLAGVVVTLAAGRLPGIFHATNQGVATRYTFVRALLEAAGHDPDRVEAFDGPAPTGPLARPEYSVLENVALPAAGVALLPEWSASLSRFVAACRS